MLSTVHCT